MATFTEEIAFTGLPPGNLLILVRSDGHTAISCDMGTMLGEKAANGGRIYNLGSLLEQGSAWEQIVDTLNNCHYGWMELDGFTMSPVDRVCDMLTDYLHLLEKKDG
jgi:hypothetical protein